MQAAASLTTDRQTRTEELVLWFAETGIEDIPLVGGKNASLGEMLRHLTPEGVQVPNGFATTAHAYREHIKSANLEPRLRALLDDLDVQKLDLLQERARKVRALILAEPSQLGTSECGMPFVFNRGIRKVSTTFSVEEVESARRKS